MSDLTTLSKKAGSELEIHYVLLAKLADHFLTGNSKRHDIGILNQAIDRYNFRDPIAFDRNLNDGKGGIVEGNGRLELLRQLQKDGHGAPKGIRVTADDWLVPVVFGNDAATEADAIAYSVSHNLSALWGGDYPFADAVRMFDDDLLEAQLRMLADVDAMPIGIDPDDLDQWLNPPDLLPEPGDAEFDEIETTWGVIVYCNDEGEQSDRLQEFVDRGFKCKALS